MQRHFILTLGRSGSNALVEVINSHPRALNTGELLGRWTTLNQWRGRLRRWPGDDAAYLDAMTSPGLPLRAVNGLRSLQKLKKGGARQPYGQIDTVGAKDFANFFRAPGLRSYFRDRPEVRVIGLYRRNPIARFVSSRMLAVTGTVARKAGEGEGRARAQITLDTDTLAADLQRVTDENSFLEELLSDLPADQVFRIAYEDFFFDPDVLNRTVAQMFTFLGLDPVPVDLQARKLNTRPLSESLANHAACLAVLAGTPFEAPFRAEG